MDDDNDDHQHLLSIFITLLTLTLLYLPSSTLLLLFSPLLLAAIPLLLILLRDSKTADQDPPPVGSLHFQLLPEKGDSSKSELDHQFDDPFVEWDVRAPLEVIYEEESENEDHQEDKPTTTETCLTRHSSLSKYFPETESDTTSSSEEYPDWDDSSSPGKICFKWEEEEDTNGLIEIELDNKEGSDFELEDSMFEIDISPTSCSRIPAS